MKFAKERFLGQGWRVCRHAEQASQTTLPQVQLMFPVSATEKEIGGYEYMRRIESRVVPVGADILEYMRNKEILNYDGKDFCSEGIYPESWKQEVQGVGIRIFFLGTIVATPEGQEAVLYVRWNSWENKGAGGARWGTRLLAQSFYPDFACACL